MPAPAGAARGARVREEGGAKKPAQRSVPSVRQGPLPSADAVARLADLSLPHVQSFSHFTDLGLAECVEGVGVREVVTKAGDT